MFSVGGSAGIEGEAIAERVEENEIARRAQGQHPGALSGPKRIGREIPIAVVYGSRVSGSRGPQREVAAAVDNFRAHLNRQRAPEPGIVREQPRAHRRGIAGEKVAVGLHARLHGAVDGTAGRGQVEDVEAFDDDARRIEDRAVDRVDLEVGAARRLRRPQVQRAREIARRGAGRRVRRDRKIDRRTGLNIEHRARVGAAVGFRAGFQRDRAAFARGAQLLRRDCKLRTRGKRETAAGREMNLAALHAGGVDRAGHIDRALIGGEIVGVRGRKSVDGHVAGAHANRACLRERRGIERRIERLRTREAADIQRKRTPAALRAAAAEQRAVGRRERAVRRAHGQAARIATGRRRRDRHGAARRHTHTSTGREQIDAAAVRVFHEIEKRLRGAADIEPAGGKIADLHIAARRAQGEFAARQDDVAVDRDARSRERQADAESAGDGRAAGTPAGACNRQRPTRINRVHRARHTGDEGRGDVQRLLRDKTAGALREHSPVAFNATVAYWSMSS